MTSKTWTAGTVIDSPWLQDVNDTTYGLPDTTSTAKGDALVGVKRTETNAVGRTLHFYIQHSKLSVSNYCDPTSDTPTQVATALANAITDAKAYGKALEFETGATYTMNAAANFLGTANLRGLRFWGNGCTLYRNTGSGPVATLDSGGTTSRCDDIEFLDFILKGQASATYGLDIRGLCRSNVRARAVDVSTAGFRVLWGVSSKYDLMVTNNVDTFTVNPATGLLIDSSSAGVYPADCQFFVVMEAPITGIGVDYVTGGLGNIFTGTCEGVSTGFRQRSGAADCLLYGMDFESNSTQDVLVEGTRLNMIGCNAQSNGSSYCVNVASTAIGPAFLNGYAVAIDIDSAATGVNISNMHVNDNVALGIKGTGSANWRGTGNSKVNSSRVITAAIPDQSGIRGNYTASLTGCTTVPSSSIDYRVDGDVVTLNIPSITGTSNSTAATITGMPASIRPSATRSDIGVVTDNGANVIGRFEIDSGGTITLRNGASAVFTAAGTKGVQASTITYKL